MKPARGPQTKFFSNYCNGIPGLANYEMPNEVCEGNFWTPSTGTGGSREPPVPLPRCLKNAPKNCLRTLRLAFHSWQALGFHYNNCKNALFGVHAQVLF